MTSEHTVASTSRIEWIDVFKGILIILVVVGHSTGQFNSWIYQFHMAAFFLVSGYLCNLKGKNDLSIIIKKFLTLMVPVFSLGIMGVLFNALLNHYGVYEFLFGSSFLGIDFCIKELCINGNMYVQYWGTFWFLATLFGVELLQIILFHLLGKNVNALYFLVSLGLFLSGYCFVRISIGQTLSRLSPRATPCKQLSLHTAFHGKSSFIVNAVISKIVLALLD